MGTDLVEFLQLQEIRIFSYLHDSSAKRRVNGYECYKACFSRNSVSKALNRVEKIPICVVVNSNRGFHCSHE